jgi:hypothetical protein
MKPVGSVAPRHAGMARAVGRMRAALRVIGD